MMKHKAYTIWFWLLAIVLQSGCVKEELSCREQETQRTMLFYMGGDNNLSSEINLKIEELQSVAIPSGYNILIYKDTYAERPQLLELATKNGRTQTTVIRDYEESNSASPEVFAAVLREVRERYPAPSYGLEVLSHASGWLPEGSYGNPTLRSNVETVRSMSDVERRTPPLKSVIIDNGSEMEIRDFANAIPDGMFDYILFDACFMAAVEVAYELKDKADYIIASSAEIISPGFTGVYSHALPMLCKPEPDLIGFCRAIEADYRTRSGVYGNLTLSLIDTKGLDALAATLRGKELQGGDKSTAQRFDRYGGRLCFDLASSYKALMSEQEMVELQAAIDGCVIWKTATSTFMLNYGGFPIREHSGLTTYIPQEQYPKLNEAYMKLKWYKLLSNGR